MSTFCVICTRAKKKPFQAQRPGLGRKDAWPAGQEPRRLSLDADTHPSVRHNYGSL